MFLLHIPEHEFFNEETSEFLYAPEMTLHLEHSLNSLALWESKWNRPFLSDGPKTMVEFIDYVKCMTLEEDIPDPVYWGITSLQIDDLNTYMQQKQTAASFKEIGNHRANNGSYISAESIYYQMIVLNIPPEYACWHLNRLVALIRFCSNKNTPKKKMNSLETMSQYRELNAARRRAMHTKG